MADVHGTTATRSASWHSSCFQDSVPHDLTTKLEAGDLRDRPKHRSSCSTVEEDFAAATVMDGSASPAIDALPSCDAISKAPRAAGYRGSDFVLWHRPTIRAAAAAMSGTGGSPDAPEGPQDPAAATEADPNSDNGTQFMHDV